MDLIGRASEQARRVSEEAAVLRGPHIKLGEPWSQLGGPQSQLGGLQSQLGGPQSQLGGPQSQVGGPQSQVGGPSGGRTDERTNGRIENLPILQDFVPYQGRCRKCNKATHLSTPKKNCQITYTHKTTYSGARL